MLELSRSTSTIVSLAELFSMSIARHWSYTSYEGVLVYNPVTMGYHVAQEEICPKTSRKHVQGYVSFLKKLRLSGLKKLLPKAHFEVANGTPEENRAYCTKESSRLPNGSSWEEGTLPLDQTKASHLATKRRWDSAFEAAKSGDMDSIPTDMRVRYYNTFKQIRVDNQAKPTDLDHACGVWIYGAPGVGKSLYCRQFEHYTKNHNKWWCGYQNEEVVVIDDMEPSNAKALSTYLKHWGDAYSFRGESKGSSLMLRPKCIIVTSNYTPQEIFLEDPMLLGAIERRFPIYQLPFEREQLDARIKQLVPLGIDVTHETVTLPEAV